LTQTGRLEKQTWFSTIVITHSTLLRALSTLTRPGQDQIRSNSASPPSTVTISLPWALVVSHQGSPSERKVAPASAIARRFVRLNKGLSGMGYAVEVFSLDTKSIDDVAWKSSPNGKWKKVAWTDQSYRYVFDNAIAAQFFFVRIIRIAEASPPAPASDE